MVIDRTEEQIELDLVKIQKSLENIGPVNTIRMNMKLN